MAYPYIDKDKNSKKISDKADRYIIIFKPKDQRQNKRDDKLEILKSVLGLGDYENVFSVLTDLRNDTRRQQARKNDRTISDINKYSTPYLMLRLTREQYDKIRKHPDVKSVTKEPHIELAVQTVPWGIDRVKTQEAWAISDSANLSRRGDGVLTVVQDTGIDAAHEDLNVHQGISFTDAALDDFSMAAGYHGTHVAGTVAAQDNSVGVVGVAPNCLLIDNKVANTAGGIPAAANIESWIWSTEHRVHVINHSWRAFGSSGGTVPGFSDIEPFHQPILDALNSGISLIAAYGNEGIEFSTEYPGFGSYPASFPEVVAVTAIDRNNNRALWGFQAPPGEPVPGSNFGISAEIAAPGKEILSTFPTNQGGYSSIQGTSMACPHVAGCVALALSNWKWNDCNPIYELGGGGPFSNRGVILRQILRATADKMGKFSDHSIEFGFGVVQADKMVEKLLLTA